MLTKHYFIPTEDEWYKAAYYDPNLNGGVGGYYDYPTGSDITPAIESPPGVLNSANYSGAVGQTTDVGAYYSSSSPYGTYDQGGNLWEWNETEIVSSRGVRGGDCFGGAYDLHASYRPLSTGIDQHSRRGFRVASAAADPTQVIPEPGSILVWFGLLGIWSYVFRCR